MVKMKYKRTISDNTKFYEKKEPFYDRSITFPDPVIYTNIKLKSINENYKISNLRLSILKIQIKTILNNFIRVSSNTFKIAVKKIIHDSKNEANMILDILRFIGYAYYKKDSKYLFFKKINYKNLINFIINKMSHKITDYVYYIDLNKQNMLDIDFLSKLIEINFPNSSSMYFKDFNLFIIKF
jgi:hypothetical protein